MISGIITYKLQEDSLFFDENVKIYKYLDFPTEKKEPLVDFIRNNFLPNKSNRNCNNHAIKPNGEQS